MSSRIAVGLSALLVLASSAGMAQPTGPKVPVSVARLDCGTINFKQYGTFFSDTYQYPAGPKTLVASCYLIKHGGQYLLWDAGLPAALKGAPAETPQMTLSVRRTIADQLSEIGVKPGQVSLVGISHWHFDHVGQASEFRNAKLIIGKEDAAMLRQTPPPDKDSAEALSHWLNGDGKLEEVSGDHDIFGDGSAVMLALPGHTPGHHALLVRLESGPVILSGDQYHFTEQVANRGVPPFNHDRADTLASHDRFDRIARNLGAKVVIQHEPDDIAKLPAFPDAAK